MSAPEKISVLNPTGFAPKVVQKDLAPRLDTLNGKTVYLVDCRFDDSDVFLKQMQAWFAEHMPAVRTVFKPTRACTSTTTRPRGRRSRRGGTPRSSASDTEAPARRRSPRTR